ncbi:SDR family NAD(P)-dependent oxidoreductase [Cognatiyoonia sp.]|uniref:SDR family NAD(P)-dependent oxidoreductase n=1 Tax=Cognatiyoonia sp. TaxID=2211652 RepID=UPI003F69914A
MERALIIGASGGIGAALAAEVRSRGAECVTLSRSGDGLDVTNVNSVQTAVDDLKGPFDVVFIATGVLNTADGAPEKSLSAITADQMADVFAVNAIGPALILSKLGPKLANTPRVGVLSARVGSIGDNRIGGWHSYRASKSALNQIVRGASIEFARTHKGSVCVSLHPGTVETPFTVRYAGHYKTAPAPEAAKNLFDVLLGLSPDQSGGFFDYSGAEIPW